MDRGKFITSNWREREYGGSTKREVTEKKALRVNASVPLQSNCCKSLPNLAPGLHRSFAVGSSTSLSESNLSTLAVKANVAAEKNCSCIYEPESGKRDWDYWPSAWLSPNCGHGPTTIRRQRNRLRCGAAKRSQDIGRTSKCIRGPLSMQSIA